MNEAAGAHPSEELAAYALGSLDPAEEASVREHVAGCERCRAELDWLRPAVDVLPASVPQLEPPRSLKRSVMSEVRADARAERGGWWSRRAGWITFRARPALVLGVVALLAAGVAGYVVSETNRAEEAVTLAGDASAVLERDGDGATLRVTGMAPLEGERVYQTWFGEDGEVEPGAAFTVAADGRAEADLGEIPAGTDEVLVTEEAEPGLPAPEGQVLLSASLS